ncbi:MAG: DUF4445 domain-containing protein [Planctomycetes bacterium]|nr:DUF4445 domain-containing protein [Planctomycetota bacterium]
MGTHKVWFSRLGRMVEAHDGENLLQLSRRAGILLDSSCGGNGSCHQCRVILHDALVAGAPARSAHFQDATGKPVAPQHRRGDQPIWLACRGLVCGALSVEAAPVVEIGGAPSASLAGWQVGTGGGTGIARVHDPQSGQTLVVDRATGTITAEESGLPADITIGREITRADALALGAGAPPALILDLSGRVVLARSKEIATQEIDTAALRGQMGELPGAISWVEWSPMKTRTVLETVSNARPVGLANSGLITCVVALMQAGMADAAGNLRPCRFVRQTASELELVLTGPDMEAITPGGQIWTSDQNISLGQARIHAVLQALRKLREAASQLAAAPGTREVVTGAPGVALTPQQVHMLGFGGAVFIPNAAGLGAARLACSA